jgi:DNA-binding CsgD family transcriptional regulator
MTGHPTTWLPPVGGAVFLILWIVGEAGRWHILENTVVFAPLAIAIGLSARLPRISLGLLIAVPALQILGVLTPPTADAWAVYLAAPIAALVFRFRGAPRDPRWVLLGGLFFSLLVGYRMSTSSGFEGAWSSWTGLFLLYRAHPHVDDFVGIAFVAFVAFLAMWALGVGLRLWQRGDLVRLGALVGGGEISSSSIGQFDEAALERLTPRERQVFFLVARGLSNAQIATAEHVSEATIKSQVRAILKKLDLRSRGQVVVFAYENSLLPI